MFCTSCGQQNPTEAKFCSSCGAVLDRLADDVTITFQAIDIGDPQIEEDLVAAMGELVPGNAMLYVKRGTNVGATYLLDTDLVRVGRNPDNDVFLDDVTVSRRHAEFRREGGHYVLQDVGSLNGTYVNGNRIESSVELHRGDEVQVGKFKLVFLTGTLEA